MKLHYIIPLLLLVACGQENSHSHQAEEDTEAKRHVIPAFQTMIDSALVQGAVLLYDQNANTYYSNDYAWSEQGRLPASTYKIPNSIIALETGVVADDSTLFEWNGEPRRLKIWEQDLIFRDAFHFSCVPCYQQIARSVGPERMNAYLSKLNYGHMDVDSANIDLFWLEGESHINQFEQIDFLNRFYRSELAISKRTEHIMKRLMVIEKTDQYTLSGKTGWSIRNGNNNGWFVGFVETENNTVFFATNVSPRDEFDMSKFSAVRKQLTYAALKHAGAMQ